MKKPFLILIIIFFFSIMVIFFLNNNNILTIKNILSPLKLTDAIVDNYFSNDIEKKSESIKRIKEIVLTDLGYDDWMDYSKYMNILVFPKDINQDNNLDVIIALNLSKDSGVVAIYEKTNESYQFKDSIKDLSYIEYVSILTANSDIFLIIEEVIDEKLGGYFYDESVVIYYKDDTYKRIFQESKNYESYFYEGWKNNDIKNPKWFKLIESNLIDIVPDDSTISIDVNKQLEVYTSDESTTSIPSNFNLSEDKEFSINYYWSDKYKYFIQQEGKIVDTGEIVGIISISDQNVDSYLNKDKVIYKIINDARDIKLEDSNNIRVLE
ncbi:hypothetical protein GOQ27_01500 [Clostridium sp. D2Q-11]|uniref:Uncharacterized protein n=1 Tax=Anaeromonas frigoriresistens TaxID=2683708 RepID=A0A942UUK5_9FIRM|nr:hypothetical protein [Anaeromonas frigoriresistens]MBS4537116.1 hypothetical protein [Anaeromonas frigoriresistens]